MTNKDWHQMTRERFAYFENKKMLSKNDVVDRLTWEPNSTRWNVFVDMWNKYPMTTAAFYYGLNHAWTHGVPGVADDVAELFYYVELFEQMKRERGARKFFNDMPDVVTLYRGAHDVTPSDMHICSIGYSWTTDRKIAEFFAFRHGQSNRAVYAVTVDKNAISAIFLSRREKECVLICDDFDDAIVKLDANGNTRRTAPRPWKD